MTALDGVMADKFHNSHSPVQAATDQDWTMLVAGNSCRPSVVVPSCHSRPPIQGPVRLTRAPEAGAGQDWGCLMGVEPPSSLSQQCPMAAACPFLLSSHRDASIAPYWASWSFNRQEYGHQQEIFKSLMKRHNHPSHTQLPHMTQPHPQFKVNPTTPYRFPSK